MARDALQEPRRAVIEPMHWLVGERPDKAVCGADRRRSRTSRQYSLVTCPRCRLKPEKSVVALHAALAVG